MMFTFLTISALATTSKLEKPFKDIIQYQYDPTMDVWCVVAKWTKKIYCRNYLHPKEWFKMPFDEVDSLSIISPQICALQLFSAGNKNELPSYTSKCITIHGKFNGKKDVAQIPK
eukprot:NODE_1023_length_2588_cov_0.371635.p4 type:complete len:115 gc:universal NODE_1023_length_2588_cov_0.371635:1268-1612(+)